MTKPADFTECVGDELPVGWEQAYDYHRGGIYYVDHVNRKYQVSQQVLENNLKMLQKEKKSWKFVYIFIKLKSIFNLTNFFFFAKF